MKNKYIYGTHISERKTREIIKYFSHDIEAKKASELTGVSRPTVNRFYGTFQERIAEICEAESPFENGEIELDESYFGSRRVRGKRGREAQGKTLVFGMLKRGFHRGRDIRKLDDLRNELLDFLVYFNEHRLHSAIGNIPPIKMLNM
jgi:transposase InsO family protein